MDRGEGERERERKRETIYYIEVDLSHVGLICLRHQGTQHVHIYACVE